MLGPRCSSVAHLFVRWPAELPAHPKPEPPLPISPSRLRPQAQLGSMIALGTAATEQGSNAPLPCIHLKGAQVLPVLALACPVAITTTASAGKFRVQVLPAGAGGRGQRSAAELAAALHCRSHGRLVGTAVSALRPSSGGTAAEQPEGAGSAEADEEAAFSSDAELDSVELSDSEGEAAAVGEAAAAGGEAAAAGGEAAAADEQPTVLQVWAPDALKLECWGLYEFELSSGERGKRGGSMLG